MSNNITIPISQYRFMNYELFNIFFRFTVFANSRAKVVKLSPIKIFDIIFSQESGLTHLNIILVYYWKFTRLSKRQMESNILFTNFNSSIDTSIYAPFIPFYLSIRVSMISRILFSANLHYSMARKSTLAQNENASYMEESE